ncbi:MAG: hypothetical protein ACWA6Y_09120 [Polaromonas sp.]
MKTSLNLAHRLLLVIDGNAMNLAAGKDTPKHQRPGCRYSNPKINSSGFTARKSANRCWHHAIAPERAAAQSPIIFANFNLSG